MCGAGMYLITEYFQFLPPVAWDTSFHHVTHPDVIVTQYIVSIVFQNTVIFLVTKEPEIQRWYFASVLLDRLASFP